jgi:hypothetical protein
MFDMLLDKPKKMVLDESYLLGGNRCSSTIRILTAYRALNPKLLRLEQQQIMKL